MRKLQAAGLIVASVAFTACNSTDNSPPITDAQGKAIGEAIATQLATTPTSFTSSDFTSTAVGGGIFFARAGLGVRNLPAAPSMSLLAPCPAVSDTTDTDQDGVPDDATFTFVLADCSGIVPGGTFAVSGTIRIQDPTSPQIDVGYLGTFTDFKTRVDETASSDFASLEFDGAHGVVGSSAGAELQENIVITVAAQQNNQGFTGTVSNNWAIAFTATNNDLEMGLPLPDGTFDVDGTFHYNISGTNVRFDITTTTPLVFDSTCALDFPFSAGEVRAHLQGENGQVYAKIVYTGCGVTPTVTFFGRNA